MTVNCQVTVANDHSQLPNGTCILFRLDLGNTVKGGFVVLGCWGVLVLYSEGWRVCLCSVPYSLLFDFFTALATGIINTDQSFFSFCSLHLGVILATPQSDRVLPSRIHLSITIPNSTINPNPIAPIHHGYS